MSACNTFTEHVWKPGECKNCFKPKSLHCLPEGSLSKNSPDLPTNQYSHTITEVRTNINEKSHLFTGGVASINVSFANNKQRGGSNPRSNQFRPPVARKPTIAVKPTMMLPCSGLGSDIEGNSQSLLTGEDPRKDSAFTLWNHNGRNCKRVAEPYNNNKRGDLDERGGITGYLPYSPSTGNDDNSFTDVLKEIVGLDASLTSSRDDFLGRITCSYRRSLERGLPVTSCLALGHISGSSEATKHVSLSDSAEIISSEGGRFCYPEFSSEGEEDDYDDDDDDEASEDDDEHESWDESDEELLAMEIRMRGQPRFANFRAATLSPVPFAAAKKWNTVPMRNCSLQRICAVDYDDSYDEILNGYPSMDSNGTPNLLSYGTDPQGCGFLSNSESITSPESSSSLPEDSSSSGSSVPFSKHIGVHPLHSSIQKDPPSKVLNSPKATETHKAVLAIQLHEQDTNQRDGGALPQALPGQPITISFSPTEEQPKPYRVVSLEKTPICKPYTVVDVSASMANSEERVAESTFKPNDANIAPPYPGASKNVLLSSASPLSTKSHSVPKSSLAPISVSTSSPAALSPSLKKLGNIRYQEVWTSSTSPRLKLPKVELPSGSSIPFIHGNHKSAPNSPTAGLLSSRTIPVKSPNLSEIKFNSYNNAGMPPFPIIIRDEPTYSRSSKNAVKVPIVINPSAYDNLAVYKSFLGIGGELPHPKPGTGARVASHTYEEIGSPESAQSSPTESNPNRMLNLSTTEEDMDITTAGQVPQNDKSKCTLDSSSVANISVIFSTPRAKAVSSPSTTPSSLTKMSSVNCSRNPVEEALMVSNECQSRSRSTHREQASLVLSQIVASIQPPQSSPESSAQGKTCSIEELYSLPPDANRSTLTRPKSLHCPTDSCKSHTETPLKFLPKSHSTSAAEAPTSQKSEISAPFPPPRSTSSPYHASNLLQRHFSNWTKASGSRPSNGDSSPGAEGRRPSDSNRPKRWISFRSFFRRRKDEDEPKIDKDKEKGKIVGLDGTVITMLPPPPIREQHWFSESKTDDPNQKPTIIFNYKPDSGTGSDGEGELRVEECNASVGLSSNPPKSRASLLISKVMSQVSVENRESQMPTATSLPSKLELSALSEVACTSAHPAPRSLSPSEGSASIGEPEEEAGMHSHSPASSSCSTTYTNLGQSRASLIPLKLPRHIKASDDTLHSELEVLNLSSKATPPPPKKSVPQIQTEPFLSREPMAQRPKGKVKPGGVSLSVANPLYDLDYTWDTASQSSSVSSDARHHEESGDSLERPVTGGWAMSRSDNGSKVPDRERKACLSKESQTSSKPHKHALYRGLESWEEVAGRIRCLHADTLRKLASRCEDRFMVGQKDHVRFGTDSWSHFRLTTGRPCCEAEDAVYYTASFAKDPLVNYAVKICRYKVKETQQQFFHSLAVQQSLPMHFNIQQDCGHFLADVPSRLLPWEGESENEEENKEINVNELMLEQKKTGSKELITDGTKEAEKGLGNTILQGGQLCSRVVVITREVPFHTVANFVREGTTRHLRNPELYERQVCLLLLQLCTGLEHMKPYRVAHCDLRLENLLLVHCQPGEPWNLELPEPNNNSTVVTSSACPARLIISNFSQAKQHCAVRYFEGDEFQTGLLIYEMLHQANPLNEAHGLKDLEHLIPLPMRSLYSQGLQRLAILLLHPDDSERIGISEARACLQCLLWGPRDDLLRAAPLPAQRHAALQNWLDLKRALMMIKFAERSLDAGHGGEGGVSLEDWLCCQYLAFASIDSIDRVVRILQQL